MAQRFRREDRSTILLHGRASRSAGSLKKYVSISGHLRWSKPREIKHNCWEILFLAYWWVPCILQPRTAFGKGLEMSFEMMLFIAAASSQLIVDGGVVFVGYTTILYPTAIDGNSAQFHLVASDERQINPYMQTYGSERVLTRDAAQFTKMRCFLGWCTNA